MSSSFKIADQNFDNSPACGVDAGRVEPQSKPNNAGSTTCNSGNLFAIPNLPDATVDSSQHGNSEYCYLQQHQTHQLQSKPPTQQLLYHHEFAVIGNRLCSTTDPSLSPSTTGGSSSNDDASPPPAPFGHPRSSVLAEGGSQSGAVGRQSTVTGLGIQLHQRFVDSGDEDMPDLGSEERIVEMIKRTGYSMVQENGQRKYGGPPPNWQGAPPPRGCEVFIGKIPRNMMEDELVPIFESVGELYEFRLMIDFAGSNRGFAFAMYTNNMDAHYAVIELNNLQVRKNRHIGVVPSIDNCRLLVGEISKKWSKEEIRTEVSRATEGVVELIIPPTSGGDTVGNPGYFLVEYENHKSAAMARRKLAPGKMRLWNKEVSVDWAEAELDRMIAQVDYDFPALKVRNLPPETNESNIRQLFGQFCPGRVGRVRIIDNYAFVHFRGRAEAQTAMVQFNGSFINKCRIEVTWVKPPDRHLGMTLKKMNEPPGRSSLDRPGRLWSREEAGKHAPLSLRNETTNMSSLSSAPARTFGTQAFWPPSFVSNADRESGERLASCSAANKFGGAVSLVDSHEYATVASGSAMASVGYRGSLVVGSSSNHGAIMGNVAAVNPAPLPASARAEIQRLAEMIAMQLPAAQVLDSYCVKYNWGIAKYKLISSIDYDPYVTPPKYLYEISIPALQAFRGIFRPSKLADTPDEALEDAAKHVLLVLGLPDRNYADDCPLPNGSLDSLNARMAQMTVSGAPHDARKFLTPAPVGRQLPNTPSVYLGLVDAPKIGPIEYRRKIVGNPTAGFPATATSNGAVGGMFEHYSHSSGRPPASSWVSRVHNQFMPAERGDGPSFQGQDSQGTSSSGSLVSSCYAPPTSVSSRNSDISDRLPKWSESVYHSVYGRAWI